jgi:hypothetical protein
MPGAWTIRFPLPYTTGSTDPTMPRVMQRSYIVKSSGPSNGPAPNVPRSRVARRVSAHGVTGGIFPSGGSTIRDVCR